MKKKYKFWVILLFLPAFMFILSSCSGKNTAKLQGKWNASGNIGDSTEMHSWYLTYEFEGRNYKMSGYPPISEEGKYEIIQENGDSLYIYFDVLKSSPETKSHEDWLFVKDSTIKKGGISLNKIK